MASADVTAGFWTKVAMAQRFFHPTKLLEIMKTLQEHYGPLEALYEQSADTKDLDYFMLKILQACGRLSSNGGKCRKNKEEED